MNTLTREAGSLSADFHLSFYSKFSLPFASPALPQNTCCSLPPETPVGHTDLPFQTSPHSMLDPSSQLQAPAGSQWLLWPGQQVELVAAPHLSSSSSQHNPPSLIPSSAADHLLMAPFPSASIITSGPHKSSFSNTSFASFQPQLQQVLPENLSAILPWEAGRFTAEHLLFLCSSRSSPIVSSPILQLSAADSLLSLNPSPVDQTDFPLLITPSPCFITAPNSLGTHRPLWAGNHVG